MALQTCQQKNPVTKFDYLMTTKKKPITPKQREELLGVLESRFQKNMRRHKDIEWPKVKSRLDAKADKLSSLHEMEQSGGEPDVIDYERKSGEYIFCDCSPESPAGRRSYCYDPEALKSRKEFKPKNSAVAAATAMGITLLTEDEYRRLQEMGEFDLKTSSWIATPAAVRKLGGALFCDRRYNRVFVYHNGAESYYAARGFRGILRV